MRVLYHFLQSVFSRRTRLALAHKGLDVELREGRAEPAHLAEAHRLTPIRTIPVLVDDGRVIADSSAIVHYLDVAYPDKPALWPRDPGAAAEALAITTAVDVAMNVLVDVGTRDWPLRNDPEWKAVSGERLNRAQLAIDSLAKVALRPILVGDSWSAADIWVYSAAIWVSGFPARASTSPLVAQMITLGFRMPEPLVTWAKQHEGRPDVRAVYA